MKEMNFMAKMQSSVQARDSEAETETWDNSRILHFLSSTLVCSHFYCHTQGCGELGGSYGVPRTKPELTTCKAYSMALPLLLTHTYANICHV